MPERTIQDRFQRADADRSGLMKSKRECAQLSLPWLLLPEGQSPNSPLPCNYQSVVSRGVTITRGKVLLAIYPPDRPWIKQDLHPTIIHDATLTQPDFEAIAVARNELFMQDLTVMAVLESANPDDDRSLPSGFYSSKGRALLNAIALGDSLERMNDDYTFTVFRLDQYVTCRDSSGLVLNHIIKEIKDPFDLSEDQQAKTGLPMAELAEKYPDERMKDLYTLVEWQPRTRRWVVRQEMNKRVINESEEAVTPFISTPYELCAGENYGRGLVEINKGDSASLDVLCERTLDFAAMASKHIPVLDELSNIREEELRDKKSGEPIRGDVKDGIVRDLGWIKVEKLADFTVVNTTIERIRRDLGPAYLIDSEMVRNSERTTAFEVASVSLKELEGVLGGVYAALNDKQQIPTYRRTVHQLKRDKLYPVGTPGLERFSRTQTLTGMSALAHQAQAQAMFSLADVAAKLGPEAMMRIDPHVALEAYARFLPMHEPGLIKSRAQFQAELAARLQYEAARKEIDVAGNIAENAASQRAA